MNFALTPVAECAASKNQFEQCGGHMPSLQTQNTSRSNTCFPGSRRRCISDALFAQDVFPISLKKDMAVFVVHVQS